MTIPASKIVSVNPGVLAAGGNALALNGLFLTESALMPAKKVIDFASITAVQNFFGVASDEAALAATYFGGYDNSTVKPGNMLFAPYNAANRAAWLQSGSLASMTLTQLKALSGVLTITIDGTPITSTAIDLSTATSFSDAATLIEAEFSGTVPVVTWNAVLSAFIFTSPTTGANSSMSVASNTLAAGLKLTTATGATLSQGDVADTPGGAMDKVVAITQNWATFTTLFEPVTADKEAFTAWEIAQDDRYAYLAWDTDAQAIVQGSTTCFGAVAKANGWDGVLCISGDPAVATSATIRNLAAFVAGAIASINFSQANGRITLAFRTSGLLVPTVIDATAADNLLANGYSFYGSYATANDNFIFFYNGQLAGAFKWIDAYVNQIFLNSQMQLALMSLLTAVGAVSYTPSGYNLLRSALLDPINAALSFGSIRTGVTLSAAQIAEINQAAGVNAAAIVETEGYYLQILDPGADARAARQTPIINLWYTDGGAVQKITMASIDVQ